MDLAGETTVWAFLIFGFYNLVTASNAAVHDRAADRGESTLAKAECHAPRQKKKPRPLATVVNLLDVLQQNNIEEKHVARLLEAAETLFCAYLSAARDT